MLLDNRVSYSSVFDQWREECSPGVVFTQCWSMGENTTVMKRMIGFSFLLQVRFGTLTDYFSALRERAGIVSQLPNAVQHVPAGYPVLSGDFYTYADRDDHYWSGYFTSRPFYKGLDRIVEGYQRYIALHSFQS